MVVKAQIHAGGRGKGGGVKVAKNAEEAAEIAQKILGMTLVTHQTGPEGRVVHRVLIDESLWRERFPDSRRAERRELWRRWLRERGAPDEACWFADLAQAGTPAPESAA